MLSKLFRPRQSTASRNRPSQLGPTPDQPTDPKPASKLVSKLKKLTKALRPSRFNRKADDQAAQSSKATHKSSLSDESWGNLAPGPFTAEDYDFRSGSPISTHQELGPGLPSMEGLSGTGVPSSRSSSPQSDFATSPPSTRLAPTFTAPVNASVHPQQPVSTTQVESRALAVRNVRYDDAQQVPALRSRHTLTPVPRTTSITQPPTPEVTACEPVEQYLLPEAKVHAKGTKQEIKKRKKWWEMGGSGKNYERHVRRDAVDYGNPKSDYCNVEEFGEKARSLKRRGANKWRRTPQGHHSSKQVHKPKKASENEPVLGQHTVEPTPFSTATDAFKYHGRTLSTTSTGAAQAPPSAARQPLGSLDLNLVLSVEAQPSLEAGNIEHSSSEDGDNAPQENGVQDATHEASSWLGEIVFPRRYSA